MVEVFLQPRGRKEALEQRYIWFSGGEEEGMEYGSEVGEIYLINGGMALDPMAYPADFIPVWVRTAG